MFIYLIFADDLFIISYAWFILSLRWYFICVVSVLHEPFIEFLNTW